MHLEGSLVLEASRVQGGGRIGLTNSESYDGVAVVSMPRMKDMG